MPSYKSNNNGSPAVTLKNFLKVSKSSTPSKLPHHSSKDGIKRKRVVDEPITFNSSCAELISHSPVPAPEKTSPPLKRRLRGSAKTAPLNNFSFFPADKSKPSSITTPKTEKLSTPKSLDSDSILTSQQFAEKFSKTSQLTPKSIKKAKTNTPKTQTKIFMNKPFFKNYTGSGDAKSIVTENSSSKNSQYEISSNSLLSLANDDTISLNSGNLVLEKNEFDLLESKISASEKKIGSRVKDLLQRIKKNLNKESDGSHTAQPSSNQVTAVSLPIQTINNTQLDSLKQSSHTTSILVLDTIESLEAKKLETAKINNQITQNRINNIIKDINLSLGQQSDKTASQIPSSFENVGANAINSSALPPKFNPVRVWSNPQSDIHSLTNTSSLTITHSTNNVSHNSNTASLGSKNITDTKSLSDLSYELSTPIQKSKLILPSKLETLDLTFQALEHSLAFAYAQNSMFSIFHRIKKSVENSSGHLFGLKQLGEILYFLPQGYLIDLSKAKIGEKVINSVSIGFSNSFLENLNQENGKNIPQVNSTTSMIDPRNMERRRNAFRSNMVKYAADVYNNLGIPLKFETFELSESLAQNKLQKSLDLVFPEIEINNAAIVSLLKSQPAPPSSKPSLSLNINSSSSKSDPFTEKPATVIANSASPTEQNKPAAKKEKPITRAKQLLERIRQKQKNDELAKIKLLASNDSGHSNSSQLTRIDLTRMCMVVDCLNFIFGIEATSVLPLQVVVSKLESSSQMAYTSSTFSDTSIDGSSSSFSFGGGGLCGTELKLLLEKLCELVPAWINIETVAPISIAVINSNRNAASNTASANQQNAGKLPNSGISSSVKHDLATLPPGAKSIVRINRSTSVKQVKSILSSL
ncbi:hypothetical protein AYI69_g11089 [Smittium culicis]|uniref:DNA replication factor Cdt1 C-terminal domain-containing protein n=1 Tax=Smittium culicis TaxID=133412 RepID=A0A1R1X178_9FUNG|nr:hypothetical protein AYI69_g11089 [Smittium culicis]